MCGGCQVQLSARLPDGALDITEDPVLEQANPYTELN